MNVVLLLEYGKEIEFLRILLGCAMQSPYCVMLRNFKCDT